MDHIVNYLLIAAFSTLSAIIAQPNTLPIVEFFACITLATIPQIILTAEDTRLHFLTDVVAAFLTLLLMLLSLAMPRFLYFVPLLLYPIVRKSFLLLLLAAVPILIVQRPSSVTIIIFALTCSLSRFLSLRTRRELGFTRQHYDVIDTQRQINRDLQHRNQELVANRELALTNERLRERNRISTEIHDNVGHLLSSTILQVGALEVIADPAEKPYIDSIQQTLMGAMRQIRDSVHDIHRDSLNLRQAMTNITSGYAFCPVELAVEIEREPEVNIHYAILAIVRESLTNTAKHSDATKVEIGFSESGGRYHLLVTDNGTSQRGPKTYGGMGLTTMEERARALSGTFHISTNHGYRIYATFPVDTRETLSEGGDS